MSSPPEYVGAKQPIRRLEIQISNFNVAIPHYVGLMKRRKNNIQKYQAQHDWKKVHMEHINVSRIVTQLKELLYQMETLRAQVLDSDINQFDKLTGNARASIMNEITEYLDMELNIPISKPASPEEKELTPQHPLDDRYIQWQEEQDEIQHQQTCLNAWNSLQWDMQQLHHLFVEFNKIVDDQKELVNIAENNIDETQINVKEGEKFLEKASRYKVVTYPLAGVILGACVGGPVGLIAGIKCGSLTALGCSILGYTGGTFLKKKEIEMAGSKVEASTTEQQGLQKSASLPENLNENKKDL